MRKLFFLAALIVMLLGSTVVLGSPYFRVDTQQEWQDAYYMGHIYPMTSGEWYDYMYDWQNNLKEGLPYPTNQFLPATLWVYGGDEWKYGYCVGFCGGCARLQANPHHARDHERGTPAASQDPWRGAGAYGRRERDAGCG